MVARERVLAEIRRLAEADAGKPPGQKRFAAETGIREHEWRGKLWAKWGDALVEAGFEPNARQGRYPEDHVWRSLAAAVQKLGHFPTKSELMMARRDLPSMPSYQAYARRGSRLQLASKLLEFVERNGGPKEVADVCAAIVAAAPRDADGAQPRQGFEEGWVYLLRSGKYHKIGYTYAIGRRSYELRLQLPEEARLVHQIATDDPAGIERYWHDRFADRRANGEWFKLSRDDVAAFKRRKFM